MVNFKQFFDESQRNKENYSNFEIETTKGIREFLKSQEDEKYRSLKVEHYDGSDSKFHSDIVIINSKNNKQVWVEVKKDKYANLGGFSYKFKDNKWSTTTLDESNPLAKLYLKIIDENSKDFIDFCMKYLKKEDIELPKDLNEQLLKKWKQSKSISDTENETQFISNKVEINDFGLVISKFYQTAKIEPVYYIQVGDDLYIIDKEFNPLNLKTKDNNPLKSLEDVYKLGRVQFRVKAFDKDGKKYFSITQDIKILSDRNLGIEQEKEQYFCSFNTKEKWPLVD